MTNRELIQTRQPTRAVANSLEQPGSEAADEKLPVLISMCFRRWWLLGILLIVAGVLSYFVATEFGKQSARVSGSLIYTGLPVPPGANVYHPPTLATYREVLFTVNNMQRVATQHGLSMPPDLLERLFDLRLAQDSSVMELTLNWASAEDGAEIVNDTMQLLIDEAAQRRKTTLLEHMKHVELTQLNCKRDVDNAAEKLRAARRRYEDLLRSGGLATERYTSMLTRVTNAQAAIDAKYAEKIGVEQQIQRVQERRTASAKKYREVLVEERGAQLTRLIDQYAKTSSRYAALQQLRKSLDAAGSYEEGMSLANWERDFGLVGETDLGPISQLNSVGLETLRAKISEADDQIDGMQLSLIPIENQLAMLQKQSSTYEADAAHEAGDVAYASFTEVSDFEKNLETAESRLQVISNQLDNMRQLEQCRSREFSVLVPATAENAATSSNKKKLFVMTFFAATLLLVSPVALSEWFLQRESSVSVFSRRWSLPLITERLLTNQSPADRPDWTSNEPIRMAALRIQQSLNHSSSIVVFNGLGSSPTPAGLLASISECLAHRGEKILIVDAIDHRHHESSIAAIAHDLSPHSTVGPRGKHSVDQGELNNARVSQSHGLSNYLSSDCKEAAKFIQSTGHANIDLIASGDEEFPIEAMASKCLTELFTYCRNTYSLILVVGPPTSSRADFQMLAARADAIVLTADQKSVKDPTNAAAIQDLIELRAPVIGVMS